jgi:hypothetical protein
MVFSRSSSGQHFLERFVANRKPTESAAPACTMLLRGAEFAGQRDFDYYYYYYDDDDEGMRQAAQAIGTSTRASERAGRASERATAQGKKERKSRDADGTSQDDDGGGGGGGGGSGGSDGTKEQDQGARGWRPTAAVRHEVEF